jgi:GNAT superfamily N-acetyltransferase
VTEAAAQSKPISVVVRQARLDDLPAIVALFAEDAVGGHGDTVDHSAMPDYRAAFDWIEASPSDRLHVAELDGQVVGTFQTTRIVSLAARGSASVKISSVQTRSDMRGLGIGATMMRVAIDNARETGAATIQLVSNLRRVDAHRFYERLGFERSHAGFRMTL